MSLGRCPHGELFRSEETYEEKKATLHPCKIKRKERRLKVVKKFVQVKCPPPEVNISTPTVVGPTGPQGIQGVQGVQGIPGKQGVEGPPGAQGPAGGHLDHKDLRDSLVLLER